ncbi:Serine/threonine-protein kinase tnni3k [Marasmius sp. AFHP31]|nr:Serine/threonine-protein kinase tnni3k [Marasmius sp. AFHP31]
MVLQAPRDIRLNFVSSNAESTYLWEEKRPRIGYEDDDKEGRVADQPVCLWAMRVFTESDVGQLVKEYTREAIVWQQLRHPNLLPFIGIHHG